MAEQMHIWKKHKSIIAGYVNDSNVNEDYSFWPSMGSDIGDDTYPGYDGYTYSPTTGYTGTNHTEYKIAEFTGKHVFVFPDWIATCTAVKPVSARRWSMTLKILHRCYPVYAKGEFESDVIAKENSYPQNSRHTDGFWYVYRGLSNHPPVITCADTDKGELEDGFTVQYSVTDEDAADSITVTEAIDGVALRSFEAVRDTEYVINLSNIGTNSVHDKQANLDLGDSEGGAGSACWLKLLNGEHTLTITAVDSRGGTAVKSIKFTKAVHVIEFMLSTPLACDAAATKAMTQMLAAVPAGALVQIFACNNGFDVNPTWVDVTLKVLNNEKIFFANTEKTADKWGYNVRVIIDRNNTTGDCFITSIGGNFE